MTSLKKSNKDVFSLLAKLSAKKLTISIALAFIVIFLAQCNLSKDNPEGYVEEYYSTGVLKTSYTIKDGKLNGVVKNYNEKGRLISTVEYKDDKKNGKLVNYNSKNGKPMIVAYFNDNIQEGPVTQYYDEGQLFRTSTYLNGRINDTVKTFWPNGKIKAINVYKMGMPAIGLKEYDKNGQLLKQPQLVIQEIDQTALLNKVILKISVSGDWENVDYYEANLVEGKYFQESAINALMDKNGVVTIDYPAPKGNTYMEKLSIVAKVKTRYGNTLILHKYHNLSIMN
ncbi:MAG TPA: hypothetical protein PK252_13795 [Bacteroidales bacterium]|nr:hypothetical protein [Bacteroidales bacterium]